MACGTAAVIGYVVMLDDGVHGSHPHSIVLGPEGVADAVLAADEHGRSCYNPSAPGPSLDAFYLPEVGKSHRASRYVRVYAFEVALPFEPLDDEAAAEAVRSAANHNNEYGDLDEPGIVADLATAGLTICRGPQ